MMPYSFYFLKGESTLIKIKCCKNCVPPKRSPRCHSTCEDYLREKAEYEKEKSQRIKKSNEEKDILEYQLTQMRKCRKRK